MLRKLINQIITKNNTLAKVSTCDDLIRQEAVLGGTIFGAVPEGHRRSFFCLDEHTWVWQENWAGNLGKNYIQTTRYEVKTDGIVKTFDGQTYQLISSNEAKNLLEAVKIYRRRVLSELYHQPA
jgi:hypothetical protein